MPAPLAVVLADAANHAAARNADLVQWLKLAALGVAVVLVVLALLWLLRVINRPRKEPCVACGASCPRDMLASAVIKGAHAKLCPSCFREVDKRVSEKAVDRLMPRA